MSDIPRSVTAALIQCATQPGDVVANRAKLTGHVEDAFRQGAALVILPELAVSGYTTRRDYLTKVAEDLRGPTIQTWRELADHYDGFIVGGICEVEDGNLFNSAVLVGSEGVLLHYRKLHPFAEEKSLFTPGNLGLPIATTRIGVIGLCVCYDLRFVEVARSFALRGVELLCVPTAWVSGFDTISWDRTTPCPQAQGAVLQANLNQMYIACASQVGGNGEYEFLGSSLTAGPGGELVTGPLPIDQAETALGVIDLDGVERAKNRSRSIYPRDDRRTDVYGIMLQGEVL